MNDREKIVRILRALNHKSRLQILECIQEGINNPGRIAHDIDRHRATIEKHLRVLSGAGIVEKVPVLTNQGHLSISYKITEKAGKLLVAVTEACQEFE